MALPLLPSQNCSNSWCQAVRCELEQLEKNTEVSIHLLRVIHNDFFRRVSAPRYCACGGGKLQRPVSQPASLTHMAASYWPTPLD